MANKFKDRMSKEAKEIVTDSFQSIIEDDKDTTSLDVTSKKKTETARGKFAVCTGAKVTTKNLTVTLSHFVAKKIEDQISIEGGKVNTIVKNTLEELYNPDTLDFKIKIEKKDEGKPSATSLSLPTHLVTAIEQICKNTGKKKSEVIDELLVGYLNGLDK